MLNGAAIQVTGDIQKRRHFLKILCMGPVAPIGFGLGIDSCWAPNANRVLNDHAANLTIGVRLSSEHGVSTRLLVLTHQLVSSENLPGVRIFVVGTTDPA